MKRYSTYIFDLDGTLLDTLQDLANATNHALRTMQLPERSVDEVRRFVGNGVRKLIERAVPADTPTDVTEKTLAEFKEYYLHHSQDTTKPYDGVTEALAHLRERGCRVAVVSNKFLDATEHLCKHYFPGLVEVAIGEHEGCRKKPSPDTVEEALRKLGVGKDDAVYVGDSDVDIETARNSALPCISVLWGFRDKDFLLSHGAQTLASSMEELLSGEPFN